MKPGIRGFWLADPARFTGVARARRALAWLALAATLAGVCLLVLYPLYSKALLTADKVLHYSHAELLRQDLTAFAPVVQTLDEAALAGRWMPVSLPYAVPKPQTVPADTAGSKATAAARLQTSRATLWFRIALDGLQGVREPTHLYLIRWLAAGQLAVYADGKLIYRSTGSAVWNLFNHPALLLPLSQDTGQPPKTLLIRLDAMNAPTAALSSLYAGDSSVLISVADTREWFAYQLPFMCSAAFVAVGMFSLAVWVRRRQLPYLLLFGISMTSLIRRWHFSIGLDRLPISDAWFIWLTLNALMWQILAVHHFLALLHGRHQRLFSRAALVLALAFSCVTLPPLSGFANMLVLRPYAHLVLIWMANVCVALGLWNAWRSQSRDARLLSTVWFLVLLFGIYDWARLTYIQDIEGYYLTPYGAILLFAVFVVIMFRRYVGAQDEVISVNESLAQRLQQREAELAESYEKLRVVEQQQMLSRERQRMMQDMHDGLGSSLTSAIRSVEHGAMTDAEVTQVLKDCMDDLKLAIDSMEPTEADLLLLLATLRFRLASRIKNAGVSLLWEVQELPSLDWLDPSAALHILRIVQEAFANTLKHTRASEITVSTAVEGAGVRVTIADNGRGFDVDKALGEAAGRGLHNQLRRAQSIGATVAWMSSPTGTCFTLWLPLKQALAAVVIADPGSRPA